MLTGILGEGAGACASLISCEHGEDGVKGRQLQERFADATVPVPLVL